MGRTAEAADDGRRALALAREIGYPAGETTGPDRLSASPPFTPAITTTRSGWPGRPSRSRPASPASWPGRAAMRLTCALISAGDLADAERVCAAGLARARNAGDLWNQAPLLSRMVDLDLRAGRIERRRGAPARRAPIAMRTGSWFELLHGLPSCGYLCAATGRAAEALTVWAACAALPHGIHRLAPGRALPGGTAAPGPAGAGPDRTRAAEDRGAAMSLATAAEYALMLTEPGPPQPGRAGLGHAQRPGTGAGHPGRPGPHQRPDRRPAVHQRPHGQLAPGPDPGQDRLPAPRRPDPPGPQRGPGLARPVTRPGTQGRRATRRAERPDLHAPRDERNGPHDRADRRLGERLSTGLRVVDRLATSGCDPIRQRPTRIFIHRRFEGEAVRICRRPGAPRPRPRGLP